MSNDTETMIHELGANTAPRVTDAKIESRIIAEHYFTAADGRSGAIAAETYSGREQVASIDAMGHDPLELMTFCVMVLENGFTVTGESACASPENYNAEIGRKVARENALDKIWPLEGYLLRQRLHEGKA